MFPTSLAHMVKYGIMVYIQQDYLETEEIVWHLWRAGHLGGSIQAQHQQVIHQSVVLYDERGELKTAHNSVAVGVVHVLL